LGAGAGAGVEPGSGTGEGRGFGTGAGFGKGDELDCTSLGLISFAVPQSTTTERTTAQNKTIAKRRIPTPTCNPKQLFGHAIEKLNHHVVIGWWTVHREWTSQSEI
jgi:hypothetical protein